MTVTINGSTGIDKVQDGSIVQADLAAGVAGNGPAFSVYKSTSQSLTGGVFTKLTFDLKEFDTNNNFSSNKFLPTVAGYYQINGMLGNGTSPQTLVAIYKNGSSYKIGTNSTSYSAVVSSVVYLNGKTDYVELYGYFSSTQNAIGALDTTYFNGSMTRAA